jgi:hypothetical protein
MMAKRQKQNWSRLIEFVDNKAGQHIGEQAWETIKAVAPRHVQQTGLEITDNRGLALLHLGLFLGAFYQQQIKVMKEENAQCQPTETA